MGIDWSLVVALASVGISAVAVGITLRRRALPAPTPKQLTTQGSGPGERKDEYAVAAQMAQYESQLFWVVMGVFLVPDTVLLGFIASLVADDLLLLAGFPVTATASVGAAISVLWRTALDRSTAWHDLRVIQARVMESELGFSVFTKGRELSDTGCAEIDGDTIEFAWLTRFLTMKWSGRILADGFFVFFVLTMILSLVF